MFSLAAVFNFWAKTEENSLAMKAPKMKLDQMLIVARPVFCFLFSSFVFWFIYLPSVKNMNWFGEPIWKWFFYRFNLLHYPPRSAFSVNLKTILFAFAQQLQRRYIDDEHVGGRSQRQRDRPLPILLTAGSLSGTPHTQIHSSRRGQLGGQQQISTTPTR